MAAAAVSNAAAKLWLERPDATYLTIKEALLETVTELTGLSSVASGGKLNLASAIDYIQTATVDFGCSGTNQVFGPGQGDDLGWMLAYPQPFTQQVHIRARGEENETGILQIRNAMGQVIYHQHIALLPGENEWQIATQSWPAGLYAAAIYTDKRILVTQLLKQ
jgi:hypothetical protein